MDVFADWALLGVILGDDAREEVFYHVEDFFALDVEIDAVVVD